MLRQLIALLFAVAAVSAAAAPAVPRIVLQTNLYVDVAAWTADDRFIVTAAGTTRNVTIWDVAQRVIVDRLLLTTPPDWGSDLLVLTGLDIAPDGATATVHGRRISIYSDQPDHLQDWRIDLASRAVTALPAAAAAKAVDAGLWQRQIDALTTLYQNGTDMTDAQATALLPKLPRSHDGAWAIERWPDGLKLDGPGGKWVEITPKPAQAFGDAALSPDGKRLAIVIANETDDDAHKGTLIRTFDPVAGRNLRWLRVDGDYGQVRWVDPERFLLTADGTNDSRDPKDKGADVPMAAPRIVEAATGATVGTLAPRCYVTPAADKVVAAGLGNCRAVKADRALWMAGDDWTKLPSLLPAGTAIDLLAASPDGASLALALTIGTEKSLLIVNVNTAAVQATTLQAGAYTAINFSPDSRLLFVAANGLVYTVHVGGKSTTPPIDALGPATIVPQMMASDGRTLMVGGLADTTIARFDVTRAKPLPPLEFPNAIAGGFMANGLMWTAAAGEGIRLWDSRTGAVVLTTYLFDNDRWFTVAPDGRYDTNLGPDTARFRWLVSDKPWQSLAPQTFIRDYYEPKLTARLLGCRAAGTCAQVFKPLRPIGDLNRVLPIVTIAKVVAGPTPDVAIVSVAARNGPDRVRPSGLFNLRLFRGGQLVAQFPATPADTAPADLNGWQAANRIEPGPDGVARHDFTVRLPTGPAGAKVNFTAYAFNDDRVKGDTARLTYTRPPVTPRPQRAFIVAIGINAYDEPRLKLNFAAADARLMDARLATIPARNEVHRLVLTGEPGAAHATKALIHAAFQILAGDDAAGARARLAAAGVDASGFDTATPDDMVIITYAGHGWAARDNDFFVFPSDGRWPDGSADPDRKTLISSGELTAWLANVDAGEMAIVIDACQSAAAVIADGFKPGPMGDRGLGQLAYDKRIRILAASQSSTEALEDPRLGHGLLTWALAGEGIDAKGYGRADTNKDGVITLDEWLYYAVRRLPKMSADLASGKLASDAHGRGFVFLAPGARPQPQEPELFNFIQQPVPVVLRRGTPGQ